MNVGTKHKRPACVLCAQTRNIERNHIGGKNHLFWVTGPLCLPHHKQFHRMLELAGVDLEYTPDPVERLIRASKAITIFKCMVEHALHEAYRNRH
jgi:hypothetical protein